MITLKKHSDKRVRRGHAWIFSNEVAHPPVSELEPGSVHELVDASGEFLAIVYANSASLITARILSRRKVTINKDFLRERMNWAVGFRTRLFPDKSSYRVVFGESDLLPGLVVDRYDTYLVVQSSTAGMDRLLNDVVHVLAEAIDVEGIYVRNDSSMRNLEGLELEKRLAYGTVPDETTIESGGLKFLVDMQNGQKTGFFLDQESNRFLMRQYVSPGAKVLDMFCYSGAWGIHAAAAGAREVTALDSSRGALSLAEANAKINGFGDRFTFVRDAALDFLKKQRQSWDVIVLDPPAFIKSRARLQEGKKGYIDLNRRAIGRLNPGGILITCSCSHHLSSADFEEVLLAASRQSGRELRILDIRGQGPDHPVLPSMPETRYLKVIAAHVM